MKWEEFVSRLVYLIAILALGIILGLVKWMVSSP